MSGRKWKRLHGGESGWRSQLQCAKKGGSVIERGTLWVSVADRGTVRSSLWWTSALQCRTRTCLVHLFCWFPFVSSNLWFCSLELDGHLNIRWTEIQPWMKMKRNPRCEQLQLLNRFFFLISPINILRLRNCIMLKNLKYIFTQHIRNSNLKRPVHLVPSLLCPLCPSWTSWLIIRRCLQLTPPSVTPPSALLFLFLPHWLTHSCSWSIKLIKGSIFSWSRWQTRLPINRSLAYFRDGAAALVLHSGTWFVVLAEESCPPTSCPLSLSYLVALLPFLPSPHFSPSITLFSDSPLQEFTAFPRLPTGSLSGVFLYESVHLCQSLMLHRGASCAGKQLGMEAWEAERAVVEM